MKKYVFLFKSIGYAFVLELALFLSAMIFAFSGNDSPAFFFVDAVILLVFLPLYFFVKADSEHPVLYLLLAYAFHFVFAILFFYIGDAVTSGIQTPGFDLFGYDFHLAMSLYFAFPMMNLVFLIDSILIFKSGKKEPKRML